MFHELRNNKTLSDELVQDCANAKNSSDKPVQKFRMLQAKRKHEKFLSYTSKRPCLLISLFQAGASQIGSWIRTTRYSKSQDFGMVISDCQDVAERFPQCSSKTAKDILNWTSRSMTSMMEVEVWHCQCEKKSRRGDRKLYESSEIQFHFDPMNFSHVIEEKENLLRVAEIFQKIFHLQKINKKLLHSNCSGTNHFKTELGYKFQAEIWRVNPQTLKSHL